MQEKWSQHRQLIIFLMANDRTTARCNQPSVPFSGGFKHSTSTKIQNDYLEMYSFWLMAFWLLSMEVTNSPVNAQLMHFPKGSFVYSLFPPAWSTDRHWPQLPDADRSLNRLDLLNACRNAHGLQKTRNEIFSFQGVQRDNNTKMGILSVFKCLNTLVYMV